MRERLRGAHALQKFPRKKFSKNTLERRGSDEGARMYETFYDFCLFLLPRPVRETLRGAHAWQKFPRKKFSKNTLKERGSDEEARIQETFYNFCLFWPPAPRAGNTAWRPCFAKISSRENLETQLRKDKIPKQGSQRRP